MAMTHVPIVRRLIQIVLVAACTAIAMPATAQGTAGSVKGRILDPESQPAAGAQITFESTKDSTLEPIIVNSSLTGDFAVGVLPAGTWLVTVVQGKFYAQRKEPIVITNGEKVDAGDIKMHVGTGDEMRRAADAQKAAIAKHNERAAKEQLAVKAADAARDAGNYDDAIAKYTDVAGLLSNCGLCYIRIGDIYLDQKNDPAEAEKAYLKAIDLNSANSTADAPTRAAPYAKLATIYNKQQKFDDASKMSAKANEVMEAGGGSADPTAAYNQGVSLWNANKFPEAQAQFAKAVKLDPKMAEAYYYLAMTLVNQNKLAEAKPNFQTYLKLAPDGPNAATAKAILDSIK
jgi:tetratricopeptide (TPR) repeat protein